MGRNRRHWYSEWSFLAIRTQLLGFLVIFINKLIYVAVVHLWGVWVDFLATLFLGRFDNHFLKCESWDKHGLLFLRSPFWLHGPLFSVIQNSLLLRCWRYGKHRPHSCGVGYGLERRRSSFADGVPCLRRSRSRRRRSSQSSKLKSIDYAGPLRWQMEIDSHRNWVDIDEWNSRRQWSPLTRHSLCSALHHEQSAVYRQTFTLRECSERVKLSRDNSLNED